MTLDDEYGIINFKTGEVEPIEVFIGQSDKWEKVFAKTLVDLLNMTGEAQTKIIAYLIKNKDYKNVVMATMKKISDETGSSTRTVQRTISTMIEQNFLIKLQNGAYLFSPHIMRSGKNTVGMAIVRTWEKKGGN